MGDLETLLGGLPRGEPFTSLRGKSTINAKADNDLKDGQGCQ